MLLNISLRAQRNITKKERATAHQPFPYSLMLYLQNSACIPMQALNMLRFLGIRSFTQGFFADA